MSGHLIDEEDRPGLIADYEIIKEANSKAQKTKLKDNTNNEREYIDTETDTDNEELDDDVSEISFRSAWDSSPPTDRGNSFSGNKYHDDITHPTDPANAASGDWDDTPGSGRGAHTYLEKSDYHRPEYWRGDRARQRGRGRSRARGRGRGNRGYHQSHTYDGNSHQ